MPLTLTHEFAQELPGLSVPVSAAPSPHPETWIVNSDLALELGLDPDWLQSQDGARFLSGLGGESVVQHPVAQRYAGHQFGVFSPLLGDGRAMLLGELDGDDGVCDLHLKGSGPTPLSRGDGFATLEATLREFLVSEAMHALGVPTTRALAVTTTGRHIVRDNFRHNNLLPGSVLARVSRTHIRIGTFQYARVTGERELLARLLHHATRRCAPGITAEHGDDEQATARTFLAEVTERQAELVARWMLVGFVHGVMNTDNVLVSGDTIDYGPCAFLDVYDPAAVFSSIDHGARYAFGAQPRIMKWNLARLADALLPLLAAEQNDAVSAAEEILSGYDEAFNRAWERGMRAKLGFEPEEPFNPSRDLVRTLASQLLETMAKQRLDYTETFRALTRAAQDPNVDITPLETWIETWRSLHPDASLMATANPVTIPRNAHLQHALDDALDGDSGAYLELLDATQQPWIEKTRWSHLATAGAGGSGAFVTFCGT